MCAWAYCTNEDCQRGFDKPSFAEIIARKRECPACGQINNVGDDLGKALDEKFAEIAELLTAGSQLAAVADDELPGLWQASDLSGGETDCDVAAGTIVPPQVPFVLGEAPRKTISHVNAENLDSTIAAGQEANTAPLPLVCTLRIAPHGVIAEIKDLAQLPAGTYNVVLISQES